MKLFGVLTGTEFHPVSFHTQNEGILCKVGNPDHLCLHAADQRILK